MKLFIAQGLRLKPENIMVRQAPKIIDAGQNLFR